MSSSPTETDVFDVTMPQMGVSVAEGTIVAWHVSAGDRIEADATICEITTDKIDTEVPSPASGIVTEIIVEVGETVEVGTLLARIATGAASAAQNGGAAPASTNGTADNGHAPVDAPKFVPVPRRAGHRSYSPVVQRIAAEHGVDLAQVTGTGRDGRVRKPDVLAFISAGVPEPPMHIESPYRPDPVAAATPVAAAAPVAATAPVAAAGAVAATAPAPVAAGAVAPASAVGRSELSRMRRQIGDHMKRSLDTAATCTTWMETDMARIEAVRAAARLTALPFVARATIVALREHQALNAWLDGDRYTRHEAVNLGIAVSLGDDGLIVPVIHNAHELSVEGLSARIKDVARRARNRQLTPDDVAGATFTITNPGQYGSVMATPIINQPQVGILDLEAVVKRAVVLTDADGNDSIAIRPMTILGLSWDHRALDGVLAAQFLGSIKRQLEGWVW